MRKVSVPWRRGPKVTPCILNVYLETKREPCKGQLCKPREQTSSKNVLIRVSTTRVCPPVNWSTRAEIHGKWWCNYANWPRSFNLLVWPDSCDKQGTPSGSKSRHLSSVIVFSRAVFSFMEKINANHLCKNVPSYFYANLNIYNVHE